MTYPLFGDSNNPHSLKRHFKPCWGL